MSDYLVVAHQTATSDELVQRLCNLAADDPQAAFTLLVPATPVAHLLVPYVTKGESREIAAKRAGEARALFESKGLNVVRTTVGHSSPLHAIRAELQERPGEWDAIVLSTPPPGVSRWLRRDVYNQAERKFNLPVIHVVAQRPEWAEAAPAGTH